MSSGTISTPRYSRGWNTRSQQLPWQSLRRQYLGKSMSNLRIVLPSFNPMFIPVQVVPGQLHSNQEAGEGEGVFRETGWRIAEQLRLEGVVRPSLRPQPRDEPGICGVLQSPVAGHSHAHPLQLPVDCLRVPASATARRLQGWHLAISLIYFSCSMR